MRAVGQSQVVSPSSSSSQTSKHGVKDARREKEGRGSDAGGGGEKESDVSFYKPSPQANRPVARSAESLEDLFEGTGLGRTAFKVCLRLW